ncbi:hypothetical protein EDD37DRAFT_606322 [Exophiala viscosa]|uniref:uncharacterized protein n=1 Tax=Exophiala viscosa TaxID=2486360 RepID=UPI002198D59B|nr:hypothetical protein EDD37DRAFT_606322 [Exophiala viscosa]
MGYLKVFSLFCLLLISSEGVSAAIAPSLSLDQIFTLQVVLGNTLDPIDVPGGVLVGESPIKPSAACAVFVVARRCVVSEKLVARRSLHAVEPFTGGNVTGSAINGTVLRGQAFPSELTFPNNASARVAEIVIYGTTLPDKLPWLVTVLGYRALNGRGC